MEDICDKYSDQDIYGMGNGLIENVTHPMSMDIHSYSIPWTDEKWISCYERQIKFYDDIGDTGMVNTLKQRLREIKSI